MRRRAVSWSVRRRFSSLATDAAAPQSNPVNGSSSTMTRFLCASWSAREALRAMPPLSSEGRLCASRVKSRPTASTSRFISASACDGLLFDFAASSATATLPATVNESRRVVCWKSAPTRSRSGKEGSQLHFSIAMPSRLREEEFDKPATNVAIVDFPHPLGPARRTQPPGARVNSIISLLKGQFGPRRVALNEKRGGIAG
mmetsp:Transcript_12676/g.25024  ORF Transcript_12676/g.25024 Transcript_12676/m.25024 type:complete len:201 (+) Transcript_12676:220-822(+)